MVNKSRKVLGGSIVVTLVLVTLALAGNGRLQTRSPRTARPADALSFLPAADAVMLSDVRRMLDETMPRILAGDKVKLAQANSEIDKFKSRTGIDPRAFDRVVLGVRYTYPTANTTKLETVAIAHGTFDAKTLAAATRLAASGKYREEKYRGATIMIVTINDQMKVLGLWNMRVSELAISALDAKTLAIGTLSNVRAAIDAGKRGRANGELIALASRDPKAVIGFGANLPRALLANLNVGNDTIAKDVNSIRQAYGSIGTTETDVSLSLVARTDNADAAKNLNDTVTGLKQLGAILIMRMAPPRKALAQGALDNLKITTRGNELEIKTQVAAGESGFGHQVSPAAQSPAREGSIAPDFALQDGGGAEWRLSDHRGKVVVLLFYPGDETPICTRQMCSVRDHWEHYDATGAEVVGISTNTVASHKNFAEHYKLPLRLLADVDRKVTDVYGARSLIPGKVARSVFVIDANGVIRYRDVRPLGLFRPKDNDIIRAIREAQR